MSVDIIRAWKDDEYRNSLSPEELAALPAHPAGFMALSDEDLGDVTGGGIWTVTVVLSMLSGLCCSIVDTVIGDGDCSNSAAAVHELTQDERFEMADTIDSIIADSMVSEAEIRDIHQSLQDGDLTDEQQRALLQFTEQYSESPELSHEQVEKLDMVTDYLRDGSNFR